MVIMMSKEATSSSPASYSMSDGPPPYSSNYYFRFSTLYTTPGKVNNQPIQLLKRSLWEYLLTMHRETTKMTTINDLPPEILRMILTQHIDDLAAKYQDKSKTAKPVFTTMRVSKIWCNIILEYIWARYHDVLARRAFNNTVLVSKNRVRPKPLNWTFLKIRTCGLLRLFLRSGFSAAARNVELVH
ncbi:hypothetical protein PMZ80_006782 [Knufia obscura]|uniref:F-box domain-containing protein n=1 Tax=Knufia obscura TaxID=1635080 RepID=A0ABR0RLM4_9EURO|nr:hypothetical protein PMZ80_006782 [Knufia obscura]